MVAGSDHKKNAVKDSSRQAFYAAETGIAEAKKWLSSQTSLSANNDPNRNLKFCKTSLFSNLSSVKAINNYYEHKTLDQIIIPTGPDANKEKERLEKYSYEFFITYTPDQNGSTDPNNNPLVPRTKQVSGSTGSSVAEGTTYKSGGKSTATHYTIFSCGCNDVWNKCKQGEDTIVKLLADIVLVQ